MEILIGIVIAFIALKSGILNSFGLTAGANIAPPAIPASSQTLGNILQPIQQEAQLTSIGVSTGVNVATQVGTALDIGSNALKAIPIAGAVIGAVASALLAASQQRAKEAVNENQAVDAALPAWDSTITQACNLLAAGQITPAQFGQLLGTPRTQQYWGVPIGLAWQNFWREVGPQVQSGRNGCNNGTAVQGNVSFCGGKTYGAGCCIAYDDMDNSMGDPAGTNASVFAALAQAVKNPGTPYTATILAIYPSKYSTYSRPKYNVTVLVPHV